MTSAVHLPHDTRHAGAGKGPGAASFSSSKFWERVAGVERSEPPEARISGGSLALDPGHPKSDHPNLELLSLGAIIGRRTAVAAVTPGGSSRVSLHPP